MPAWLYQPLLVGAGGFLGSVLRFGISGWVQRFDPAGTFPYGTLAVNGAGCLAIGLLAGLADTRQVLGPDLRIFLLIGVLGGFTTFSTFGYETLALVRDGEQLKAGANAVGTLALCLGAVWLGYAVGSSG